MLTTKKLHKDGSFHEQKEYVDGLPKVSKDDALNRTINTIKAQPTPFDVDAKQIPSKIDVTVFHHAVADNGESDSDDEDNEMKSSTAVVTRQLNISSRQKTEKLVMHFPDDKSDSTQTIKVKFRADGTVSVHQRNVPMPTLQKDLLLADGKKQAGIVVEAHDKQEGSRRYSAYTKR